MESEWASSRGSSSHRADDARSLLSLHRTARQLTRPRPVYGWGRGRKRGARRVGAGQGDKTMRARAASRGARQEARRRSARTGPEPSTAMRERRLAAATGGRRLVVWRGGGIEHWVALSEHWVPRSGSATGCRSGWAAAQAGLRRRWAARAARRARRRRRLA